MKKNTLRDVVDTVLFVSMLGTIVVGILLGFVLPQEMR
jgi:hypothetical protein